MTTDIERFGRLLGIDTSNAACSCALWVDGQVSERYHEAARGHGDLILPMVEGLLAEAGITLSQLDALVLGHGPGSFTGLRIAVGVVQGLAFAVDRPVVPVSSLAALAQVAGAERGGDRIAAAFDARMGEVYWGLYERGEDGLVDALADDRVVAPTEVEPLAAADWVGVGEGWQAHRDTLMSACRVDGARVEVLAQPLFPRASGLVQLGARAWRDGAGVAADRAQPVYLRNKVV